VTVGPSVPDTFEGHRERLTAVATRLLGSTAEAEDAVQETWLRYDRTDPATIENLGGWLTTVVSRICLDQLRARQKWSDEPIEYGMPELGDDEPNPEDAAILAESSAEALALLLDSLSPLERVAFVLHDVFAVPFEDVASVLDRSQVATRQLASRARRNVREATGQTRRAPNPHREIVAEFFAAAREGRMQDLLHILAPEVVLRADAVAQLMGMEPQQVGASVVADGFFGGARAARLATINGEYGAFWAPGGQIQTVFQFTIDGGLITAIDLIGDPDAIAGMAIVPAIVRHRTAKSLRPRHTGI
jgi:RNA polymerase sigma-70 factor (ECF subfamily)